MITNVYLIERKDCVAYLRSEAARFRARDDGADQAVAAHFEIAADHIECGRHEGAMPSNTEDNHGK